MKKHVNYLKYVLRHKYYVFKECCKRGKPIMGLLHDMSKFSPAEFIAYANFFYDNQGQATDRRNDTGYYKPYCTGVDSFDKAWLHHQNGNKHHWQYWVVPTDEGISFPMKIPEKYLIEMLCDWIGAAKAQGTDKCGELHGNVAWYNENGHKMTLHEESRAWLEKELSELQIQYTNR